MSYFVINKQLDYDLGFLSGGEYRDGRLFVSGDMDGAACFVSRLFDSRKEGCEWGRFVADARKDVGAGLQIAFYASETPIIQYRNRDVPIRELIQDKRISAEKKKEIFEPLFKKRFVGFRDVLLHGIRGRYLFFILDLYRQENENSCGDMCLFFPKTSWLKYLPSVYSRSPEEADFVERYLGIFQSFYEDREREIRNSAELLHPGTGGRAILEELGAWHDFPDLFLWPDDKLNELIRRAPRLRAKHGTAYGMKEYLKLYTGTEPEITEDDKNPNLVLIAVPERYLTDMREYRLLLRIIGHMLPAGMEVRVTPLAQSGRKQGAMSIGINSFLGGPYSAESDSPQYPGIILEKEKEDEK
ncbi:MAG: hypothetical protein Q4A32_01755 [Lachnospiraceae bacterium]|nr:hypothetical protein [Lachnospiraceae bacterium]